MEEDFSHEFSQAYRLDEAHHQETVEEIRGLAKDYGVTAVYSDGKLRLSGNPSDVRDMKNERVSIYEGDTLGRRNSQARLDTALHEIDETDFSYQEEQNGGSEDFSRLVERLEDSSNQEAVADGGENKGWPHSVPEKYVAKDEEPPESTI